MSKANDPFRSLCPGHELAQREFRVREQIGVWPVYTRRMNRLVSFGPLAFLVIFLFAVNVVQAQGWLREYSSATTGGARALHESGSGFVIAGAKASGGPPVGLWVASVSDEGVIVWEKSFNGPEHDFGHDLDRSADGGWVVAGDTNTYGDPFTSMWLLKLDTDGNVVHQHTYHGTEHAYAVAGSIDGGALLTGNIFSFETGQDLVIVKVNAFGKTDWVRAYAGPSTGLEVGWSISPTADGGYVVAGETSSFGAGDSDVLVIRISSSGDLLWQRAYGGPALDLAQSIVQTADGGYIVAGSSQSWTTRLMIWVLKLAPDGSVQWQRLFAAHSTFAHTIRTTADGGYVIAGSYKDCPVGCGWNPLLLRLDAAGQILWQRRYDTSSGHAYAIEESSDGTLIVAGGSIESGNSGLLVARVNSHGAINGSCLDDIALTPIDTTATTTVPAAQWSAPAVTAIPTDEIGATDNPAGTLVCEDLDDDNDGIPDSEDGCPDDPGKDAPGVCGCGVPDADTDGDFEEDCNDNCPTAPNGGQTNSDGDPTGDACDCDSSNDQAWAAPGPVAGVELARDFVTGLTTIHWDVPLSPGSTTVVFDTLRSDNPWGFARQMTCLESDHVSTSTQDGDVPAANALYAYLIRAVNACPGLDGSLGAATGGTPRNAALCP